METNEELIQEARDMTLYARTAKHGAVSHADMIDKLADALEAATTEWEYGHEGDTLIGVHANASRAHALEDAESLTRYWAPHDKKFRAVRRRAAGPWLPVEGGNDVE